MKLSGLLDLIVGLPNEPDVHHLNILFEKYKSDFVDNPFVVDNLKIKVINQNSNIRGFEKFPETFVHLITRKNSVGKRQFDRRRANKIHWIKIILENKNEPEICCFSYKESNGAVRKYFWYKEEDFIVILEEIIPEILVITAFAIDGKGERKSLEKKYQKRIK